MRKLLVAAGLLGIILIVSAAGSSGGPGGAESRPGSPAVYAEIAADSSCTSLQETFDRAEGTSRRPGRVPDGLAFEGARARRWSEVGIGYMEAADARMRQIGCYR